MWNMYKLNYCGLMGLQIVTRWGIHGTMQIVYIVSFMREKKEFHILQFAKCVKGIQNAAHCTINFKALFQLRIE